eukprot:scaffold9942_cov57-Phaeocystis_antarctica.AAC.2
MALPPSAIKTTPRTALREKTLDGPGCTAPSACSSAKGAATLDDAIVEGVGGGALGVDGDGMGLAGGCSGEGVGGCNSGVRGDGGGVRGEGGGGRDGVGDGGNRGDCNGGGHGDGGEDRGKDGGGGGGGGGDGGGDDGGGGCGGTGGCEQLDSCCRACKDSAWNASVCSRYLNILLSSGARGEISMTLRWTRKETFPPSSRSNPSTG